jgi:hypothetical protein
LILPLLFSLPHVVAGLGHGGLFKMLNSLASLYLLCAAKKRGGKFFSLVQGCHVIDVFVPVLLHSH